MFQKGKAAEWRPAGPRGEVPRHGFDKRKYSLVHAAFVHLILATPLE